MSQSRIDSLRELFALLDQEAKSEEKAKRKEEIKQQSADIVAWFKDYSSNRSKAIKNDDDEDRLQLAELNDLKKFILTGVLDKNTDPDAKDTQVEVTEVLSKLDQWRTRIKDAFADVDTTTKDRDIMYSFNNNLVKVGNEARSQLQELKRRKENVKAVNVFQDIFESLEEGGKDQVDLAVLKVDAKAEYNESDMHEALNAYLFIHDLDNDPNKQLEKINKMREKLRERFSNGQMKNSVERYLLNKFLFQEARKRESILAKQAVSETEKILTQKAVKEEYQELVGSDAEEQKKQEEQIKKKAQTMMLYQILESKITPNNLNLLQKKISDAAAGENIRTSLAKEIARYQKEKNTKEILPKIAEWIAKFEKADVQFAGKDSFIRELKAIEAGLLKQKVVTKNIPYTPQTTQWEHHGKTVAFLNLLNDVAKQKNPSPASREKLARERWSHDQNMMVDSSIVKTGILQAISAYQTSNKISRQELMKRMEKFAKELGPGHAVSVSHKSIKDFDSVGSEVPITVEKINEFLDQQMRIWNNTKNSDVLRQAIIEFQVANLVSNDMMFQGFSRQMRNFGELPNELHVIVSKLSARDPDSAPVSSMHLFETLDSFAWRIKDAQLIRMGLENISTEDQALFQGSLEIYQSKYQLTNEQLLERINHWQQVVKQNFSDQPKNKELNKYITAFIKNLDKIKSNIRKQDKNYKPDDPGIMVTKRILACNEYKHSLPTTDEYNKQRAAADEVRKTLEQKGVNDVSRLQASNQALYNNRKVLEPKTSLLKQALNKFLSLFGRSAQSIINRPFVPTTKEQAVVIEKPVVKKPATDRPTRKKTSALAAGTFGSSVRRSYQNDVRRTTAATSSARQTARRQVAAAAAAPIRQSASTPAAAVTTSAAPAPTRTVVPPIAHPVTVTGATLFTASVAGTHPASTPTPAREQKVDDNENYVRAYKKNVEEIIWNQIIDLIRGAEESKGTYTERTKELNSNKEKILNNVLSGSKEMLDLGGNGKWRADAIEVSITNGKQNKYIMDCIDAYKLTGKVVNDLDNATKKTNVGSVELAKLKDFARKYPALAPDDLKLAATVPVKHERKRS